ncbi:MAG: hypothetical protein AB1938_16260 [Myxococcota bacterium]
MELEKKTTILLSARLHSRLTRLARRRKISLGELIRRACEREYGLAEHEQRRSAVRALADLRLPVADVATMKAESIEELE